MIPATSVTSIKSHELISRLFFSKSQKKSQKFRKKNFASYDMREIPNDLTQEEVAWIITHCKTNPSEGNEEVRIILLIARRIRVKGMRR
jgi:hypothetical protein